MAKPSLQNDGHITTTITHDIRNALSSLNIYMSTLQRSFERELGREQERGILEQVKSFSNQIQSVIKTATDFIRPGKPKLKRCNLNQLVEETPGSVLNEPAQEQGQDHREPCRRTSLMCLGRHLDPAGSGEPDH